MRVMDAWGVILRPGDTLVLVAKAPITAEWIGQVTAEAAEHLPGVKIAIVGHVEYAFVYRQHEAGAEDA